MDRPTDPASETARAIRPCIASLSAVSPFAASFPA